MACRRILHIIPRRATLEKQLASCGYTFLNSSLIYEYDLLFLYKRIRSLSYLTFHTLSNLRTHSPWVNCPFLNLWFFLFPFKLGSFSYPPPPKPYLEVTMSVGLAKKLSLSGNFVTALWAKILWSLLKVLYICPLGIG